MHILNSQSKPKLILDEFCNIGRPLSPNPTYIVAGTRSGKSMLLGAYNYRAHQRFIDAMITQSTIHNEIDYDIV